MTLIRPEITAGLLRWREVIACGAVAGLGLWLIWLGGYLLVPLGGGVVALGAGLTLLAMRRLRFAQTVEAPGVVEVDEAQVGYLGPAAGGFVALPDLVELRLIVMRGRRLWRLKQVDGQALLIPVDAAGADRLFDAFASLPGMDTQALMAAVQPHPPAGPAGTALIAATDGIGRVIWRRPSLSGGLDLTAAPRHQ